MRSTIIGLNWRIVRLVGELTILTKASYWTLLAVPPLAAFSPMLNTGYAAAMRWLHAHAGTQSAPQTPLVPPVAVSGPDAPAPADDQAVSNRDQRRLKLPWTFAAAFFAALNITIGHFIYQVFVPEEVRRSSRDSFVRERLKHFKEFSTEDALDQARKFGSTETATSSDPISPQRIKAAERKLLSNLYAVSDDSQTLAALLATYSAPELNACLLLLEDRSCGYEEKAKKILSIAIAGEAEKKRRPLGSSQDLQVIREGAWREYDLASYERPFACHAGAAFYVVGLAIVFSMITHQIVMVYHAAAWTSPLDALFGTL